MLRNSTKNANKDEFPIRLEIVPTEGLWETKSWLKFMKLWKRTWEQRREVQCLEDLPLVSSRSNHKSSQVDIEDRAGGTVREQTKVPSMSAIL